MTIAVVVVAVLVSSVPASAHVVHGDRRVWIDPAGSGKCLEKGFAEISDGSGGHGYTRAMTRAKNRLGLGDFGSDCTKNWNRSLGELKASHTVWYYHPAGIWTLCAIFAPYINPSETYEVNQAVDWGAMIGTTPCHATGYFSTMGQSQHVWPEGSGGSWMPEHTVCGMDPHYHLTEICPDKGPYTFSGSHYLVRASVPCVETYCI